MNGYPWILRWRLSLAMGLLLGCGSGGERCRTDTGTPESEEVTETADRQDVASDLADPDPQEPPPPAHDEEFLGPFPSWKSVRLYGAVGDGVADDTDAIQAALEDARDVATNAWSVVYLPAGTYRITRTIAISRRSHNDFLGLSIVGEDPATTILRWDGPCGGDMLHLDLWYGKVSRLTFDGNGKANIGLYRGDAFSTFCELSDLWFQDMEIGIAMGYPSVAGQAEHLVLRCRFQRCTQAGVMTWNWNSLDIWIWNSLFEDCRHGVYNVMGNFHVYDSVFLRSSEADIGISNLATFFFVGNTSVGSRTFLNFDNPHSWSAQVLLKGNRIYDVTSCHAFTTGTAGPWLIVDNTVRTRETIRRGPVVRLAANDQILVGNTYTVDDPIEVQTDSWRGPPRVWQIDTTVVNRSQIPPPVTRIPDPPRNHHRKVFEVLRDPGDDARAIQTQIDLAAREPPGTRPVVHIPKGIYTLRRTVVVPGGRDLQIVGDGTLFGTILEGWEIAEGPALRLEGPSRATIRDLEIRGRIGGMVIEKADQPGGRVYARLVSTSGRLPSEPSEHGIRVEGLEHSDVTIVGSNFGHVKRGVVVSGGPDRSAGRKAPGQVSILTGASSHAGRLYDVTDGGELLAEAIWYEGGLFEGGTGVHLTSSGRITLAGLFIATPLEGASQPLLTLDGFRGHLAYLLGSSNPLGTAPSHHVRLAGDGTSMRVLFAGNMFWLDRTLLDRLVDSRFFWRDETSPRAQASFFFNTINSGQEPAFEDLAHVTNGEMETTPSDDFVRDLLAQLREARIEPPNRRPDGVTDVKILHVYLSSGPGGTSLSIRR